MRVQKNSEDIGRCGCGRRDYCDGSHGLTETQWQEVQAKELVVAEQSEPIVILSEVCSGDSAVHSVR